jgi:outer membrane protein TolC
MWIGSLSRCLVAPTILILAAFAPAAVAQRDATAQGDALLDSLVSHALAASPSIIAASRRVDAARARVGPAGARPDPTVMAGIQNQPLGYESGMNPDPMTMHMVGVSQTLPYPGKLALRTETAKREVDVVIADEEDAKRTVAHDVKSAYFELAYADRALAILERNRAVLVDIIKVTEVHYTAGTAMQQDVLKARVEAASLGEQASALRAQRRTQVAALNALLNRPSDTPIATAAIPERIARAAVADSASHIRFVSAELGAPVADSPLPSLAALQAMGVENNAMLHAHEARIAAQDTRIALAEKETKPDFDLSLQYGQRNGRPAMVSAVFSIPIPMQRRRKQDQDVAAARSEAAALEAEHHAQVNDINARVAKLYADLERQRTQLALDVQAILPQGEAVLAATTSSYQAGKTDLLALLDSRSTLFSYQLSYARLLSDFAESIADLEQVVGRGVLP